MRVLSASLYYKSLCLILIYSLLLSALAPYAIIKAEAGPPSKPPSLPFSPARAEGKRRDGPRSQKPEGCVVKEGFGANRV